MARKKKIKSEESSNKFFEVLKNVYEEKTDRWDEFVKDNYSYGVFLMASNSDKDIHVCQMCNELSNLSPKNQYLYLLNALPKRRRFNKYPKKEEDLNTVVNEISFYYGVSKEKARGMMEVHQPEQLSKIHEYYVVNNDGTEIK